jgi:Cu-processing system permease protein
MRITVILARTALVQVLRSRSVIGYSLAIAGMIAAVTLFGGDAMKVTLTLVSLLLFIVPLVTLLLVALHEYNNREFTELILAQPISRSSYYWGEWIGSTSALSIACLVPILLGYVVWQMYDIVLVGGSGLVLTLSFSGLAYRIAIGQPDKARGIGLALLVWLYCAVLYDALVVVVMAVFHEYPLENFLLVLLAFNPIDAIRVAVLLQTDTSALMGITGAYLREFFGTEKSLVAIAAVVAIWVGYPLIQGARVFRKRDF